jgi:hypothetical protein
VLSRPQRRRTTEIAVLPLDGDLSSLHNALAVAGVRVVPLVD